MKTLRLEIRQIFLGRFRVFAVKMFINRGSSCFVHTDDLINPLTGIRLLQGFSSHFTAEGQAAVACFISFYWLERREKRFVSFVQRFDGVVVLEQPVLVRHHQEKYEAAAAHLASSSSSSSLVCVCVCRS